MTEDDKNLIDLEVTSFMTACATGVDTLKALLQRERLRRMEQESAAARAAGEAAGQQGSAQDDGGLLGAGGAGAGGGGELRPGSRPAHEHAAVTFLFERLKAVTEVAETMQVRCGAVLCCVASLGHLYETSGVGTGVQLWPAPAVSCNRRC